MEEKKDAKYWTDKAHEAGIAGDYQQALEYAEKAVELDPEYADGYFQRGNARCDLRQHEVAIADFDEAIRHDPEYADAYNNRGVAKRHLGQNEAAIADYDEAIRLDPEDAVAYNNRGSAKGDLGQHEAAIADFDEVIRLDPEYAAAYHNRGIAKRKLGRAEEAIGDFKRYIALAENDPTQKLWVGRAKAIISELEESLTGETPVGEATPSTPSDFLSLGREKGTESAAVIFIDMVNSTSIMGEYGVDHFVMLFGELQQNFSQATTGKSVSYIKGLGDGIMAISPSRDDAVETMSALLRLTALRNKKGSQKEQFDLRIGIAYGQVTIDENDRFGEPVVIAQRLEGLRKEEGNHKVSEGDSDLVNTNRLLICEVVKKQVGDHFSCQSLGVFKLKGLPRWHEVYAVDWEKGKK